MGRRPAADIKRFLQTVPDVSDRARPPGCGEFFYRGPSAVTRKESDMGGSSDTKQEHGSDAQQQPQQDPQEGGNSGHGAASALARMISQGREHRHHTGEADDAAGVNSQ